MNRKIFYKFLIVLLLMASVEPAFAWKKFIDKNGVTAYRRAVPGSKIFEVLAKVQVKTSLFSLISLFDHVDLYKYWFFSCEDSYVIKKISRSKRYVYIETKSPVIVKNRDNVLFVRMRQYKKSKIFEMKLDGRPDYIPKRKSFFRVPRSYGKIKLIPLGDGIVEVQYKYFFDPGGAIPIFIVNAFAKDFYYNTMNSLRSYVMEEKFQKAHYSYYKNVK